MPDGEPEHLSQISTSWTCLFQVHAGDPVACAAAREQLLRVYGEPIRRYLVAVLRDPDAADELYQEFALRLVRGDFHRVHPDRGRFRDFVKSVLYHLVVDHHRQQRRNPAPLPADHLEPAAPPGDEFVASDAEFLNSWRTQLLARTWRALEDFEKRTGQVTYTVLRLRADRPELKSPQLAELLSAQLQRPVGVEWVRKRLHVARKKLGEFLLDEITRTLENPTPQDVDEELEALGLLKYVRVNE